MIQINYDDKITEADVLETIDFSNKLICEGKGKDYTFYAGSKGYKAKIYIDDETKSTMIFTSCGRFKVMCLYPNEFAVEANAMLLQLKFYQ